MYTLFKKSNILLGLDDRFNPFHRISPLIPRKKNNYIIQISYLHYFNSFLIGLPAFIFVHLHSDLNIIAKIILLEC